MRTIPAALAALLAVALVSPASATCKCRARGVIAAEGQTLCIRTPDGVRLARCGKVLNVASWIFLDGACPQAALEGAGAVSTAGFSRPALASVIPPRR
jgi:hypothetical protein